MKLRKITIDCVRNEDKTDLRCGGPQYLGFDFCIMAHHGYPKDIEKIIRNLLEKHNRPIIDIIVSRPRELNCKAWSFEEIEQCIQKGYD